jgi:hypothetical protein
MGKCQRMPYVQSRLVYSARRRETGDRRTLGHVKHV